MPDPVTTYSISQLKLNAYRVWVGHPNVGGPESLADDITPLVTSIQWDYDLDQASEKFTITVVKVRDLARHLKPMDHIYIAGIKVSSYLGIGNKIEPLKFGIIIEGGIRSTSAGEMSITAYDIMYYLTANKVSHILQAESATSFISRIAGKYQIPLGHVDDTKEVIGPAPFFEQSLFEMFVSCLSLTRDVIFQNRITASGGDPTNFPLETRWPRFYLRTQVDKVALLLKTDPSYIWKFESRNIFEAESSWSAQSYRNAVQVYRREAFDVSADGIVTRIDASADGDISALAMVPSKDNLEFDLTDKDIKNYGLLIESVSLVGASDPQLNQISNVGEALYQAQELYIRLKRITSGGTISTVNINGIGPGDVIYIEENITGLSGKYYVKAGQHKVTAKESTMSLTVTLEDLLPEAYKSKPENSSTLLGGPVY